MQEPSLFLIFIKPLNRLGVKYMVTGSVAAMLYGEPRLTHDVDLVLTMSRKDSTRFIQAFPDDEFYCPPPEVIGAELSRERRGHFNLIHHSTGFKADIYLTGEDPLLIWGLDRTRTMAMEGEAIIVAPPEYVIVKKLAYYQEGQSEKHLRDVRSIIKGIGSTLQLDEINRWVSLLKLQNEWQRVNSPDLKMV